MNTRELTATLTTLFSELVNGVPPSSWGFMLNRGDEGLLASLDRLSAADASRSSASGATIAAHVDHLRYGLSLMNRWTPGANPWREADWRVSWRTTRVTDEEWARLRAALRQEAQRLRETLGTPMDVSETELTILVGNIAHLAYHLGAIRQIHREARGPTAEEEARLKAAAS